MKLVTVQTFDNAIDVALLKSKLESEGVICYVFDEYTVTINPLLSNGIGGIKLKINENDSGYGGRSVVVLHWISYSLGSSDNRS